MFRKYATDFIACSKSSGEFLFGDIKQITIINNSIDREKFRFNSQSREIYRKKWKLNDQLVIGTVGRLSKQKNTEFLLEIFREIHANKKNSTLLIVGKGKQKDSLLKKAKDMSLEHAIRFLGVRDDIPDIMSAMDIFVLPSRFEGFGIVLLEAQVVGLPCFSSDKVPKETCISDYITYLSLDLSPNEWAQKIMDANSVNREQGIALLEDSMFNIKNSVKVLENYYLQVVRG